MSNPNTAKIVSAALAQDLAQGAQEGAPPDDAALQRLIADALQAQEGLPHPYHNAAHVRSVLRRCEELAQQAALSADERCVLLVSAAYHDFGHAGATYRQLKPGVERADLSNEEFAALCADSALAGRVSPHLRLAVQGAILATSYGQRNPAALPDPQLYRPYQPHTKVEKLLAFADVANFLEGVEAFGRDNINVRRELGGAREKSFAEYLDGCARFLAYVADRLTEVAPYLPDAYARKLTAAAEAATAYVREARSAPPSHPWARAFNEFLTAGAMTN